MRGVGGGGKKRKQLKDAFQFDLKKKHICNLFPCRKEEENTDNLRETP